jgi:excisionase family DNA binding protein
MDDALLLRIREAAQRYEYAPSTLYEWAAGGVVPGFVRVGRSVRIHREVFEKWLEEQAKAPRDAA